jgi:hypothetical protein
VGTRIARRIDRETAHRLALFLAAAGAATVLVRGAASL